MNARLREARPEPGASKRPANVSVNAGLLDKAKRLGINLSQTLEDRLADLVREAEAREWLAQNQGAIDVYNKRVEREGLWSDGARGF